MLQKSRVGLAQTGDRKENVRQSLELVKESLIPKLADQVLLKPNSFPVQTSWPQLILTLFVES